MADIKISELSQAESLSLSDLMESAIPYNGGFQSRRMSLAQLSNYLENSVLHNALDTTAKNIIGAINEIVLDLANYYTKSETYSKTKIDELIAGVSGLHFLVVQTLPVSDIDPNTIYLVPKQDVGTQDIYDEFIYIVEEAPTPSHWEKIGITEIDLSDYVTDTELATILNDYVTTSGLNTILTNYATTSAMTTALADKVDKVQGKGLSTEDYTTVEKAKLNGIEPSAQVNDHLVKVDNVNNNIPEMAFMLFRDVESFVSGSNYSLQVAAISIFYPRAKIWRFGHLGFFGEMNEYTTNKPMFLEYGYTSSTPHNVDLQFLGNMQSEEREINVTFPPKSGELALKERTVQWSEQNLLGAKNLIPFMFQDKNVTSRNGITFTVNADYSVTVGNGSPSANTNWYYCYREAWKSGKYILTGFADTNQGNNFCLRAVINQDLSGSRTYNDNGEGVEVTVNDGEVLSIYLHMSTSGVSNGNTHYAMIRPSTVADAIYQEPTLTSRQLTETKLDKSGTMLYSEDLNDIVDVGFYTGINGNICANKPSGFNQFGMYVVRTATSGTGNYYKQIIIRPNAQGEIWSRSCVNDTWSAWTQEIATDENVKQVNDTTSTAFPLLLANSNTDTTEKSGVKKNLGVTFQPSNGTLRMARPHTSTTTQDQQIVIGNNIENGTSGSVRGVISLYPKGSAWTKLFASEASETRSYFLPKDRPNNSEIAVTSDLASYNGLGAKNLLPMKTYNQSGYTSNGATFIVNDDGTVTVNRSTTSGIAQFYITNNTVNGGLWLPNGTYYLSGCPEGGSTSTYELGVRYVKNGSTLNTINDTGSGTTFTIDGSDYSNDGAWVRITLILRANVSASNMLWKPMVMFDSLADKSFAPPALTNRRLTTDKLDASEIATVENTDNASQAYAVGDYMIWRGGFYRVTVAISSGGTISTSNVTKTTLGAELKRALT